MDLSVGTSRVNGGEPRGHGRVGDDVLPGGKGGTESLGEADEPLLGRSIGLVHSVLNTRGGLEVLHHRVEGRINSRDPRNLKR